MALRILVLALAWLAPPALSIAQAAALIELETPTRPVRIVVDRAAQRVLMTAGELRTLFDLGGGFVYHGSDGAAVRAHARYRPGYDEPPPYRLERFGPGPIVAGHASEYHVLLVAERVCAEMMLSAWMLPFVDPAVRAIGLLQQLGAAGAEDPCAAIPFSTYAAGGWPLLAGKADRPTLTTTAITFDYQPAEAELAPPATFTEVGLAQLAAPLAAYGF